MPKPGPSYRAWIEVSALLIGFIILIALTLWGQSPTKRTQDDVLLDTLTDLYTWNYYETSNPTKRERLKAGLLRLGKEYRCDILSAQPDLRAQCYPLRKDLIERMVKLLEESK